MEPTATYTVSSLLHRIHKIQNAFKKTKKKHEMEPTKHAIEISEPRHRTVEIYSVPKVHAVTFNVDL